MTWARFDDQFPDHPKVRSLGVFSLALQAAAICYCSRYLTDGHLSWSVADQLVASLMAPFSLPDGKVLTPSVTSGMTGEDAADCDWKAHMVEAGLWEARKDGYYVHDYLDYNPSKKEILQLREMKERAGQAGGQASAQARAKRVVKQNATTSPAPSPVVGGGNSRGSSTRVGEADATFLAALRDNPAYKHIDLEQELGRMRGWLLTPRGKGRKLTRQFIVNWLNKVDRPVEGSGQEDPEWRKGLNLG